MSELLDLLNLLSAAPFWASVLRIATPLILGTLGVLLCERAGVLNLGIEGIMVAGAFTGWLAVHAGLGYAIDKQWGLFASVGRVDVKTKLVATASTVLTSNIDLRPRTYTAGLSYRF